MADTDWVHQGDLKRMKAAYAEGNEDAPFDVLEYCRVEKKPIPAWAVDAIVAIHKSPKPRPKRMGRHARFEERYKQLIADGSCFFNVQYCRKAGFTWDRSYDEVAKIVGLSSEAVRKAHDRHEKKIRQAVESGSFLLHV